MKGRAVPILVALALTLAWSSYLGYRHWRGEAGMLDRLEAVLLDIRFGLRGERAAPDLVTIVAIDDELARREGRYPVSRSTLGEIVDALVQAGAGTVVVDVLLLDASTPFADSGLASALARHPSVIASAAVFSGGTQIVDAAAAAPLVPVVERFLDPIPAFADVSRTGVVNVATDATGTPRQAPLLFRSAERLEPSLPLRVASVSTRTDPEFTRDRVVVGGTSVPTDLGQSLPLAYYGPRGTILTLSGADVLAGDFRAADVAGRIVVIGATVTGGGDVFPSPFDPVLPGVEVISTAITHLLAGDGLKRDRAVRLADIATATALALATIACLAWRVSILGFAAIVVLFAAWIAGNLAAFSAGYWMSAALPIAAALPAAALFGAAQIWLGRHRAAFLEGQRARLARLQDPRIGLWMQTHPDFLARPVRQDAAIVFIDISGFTGLTQAIGAAPMRDMLDRFYDVLNAEVTAAGGVVTSYMGDGAMIVFGLPEPSGHDARDAVRCCLGLSRHMDEWLAGLPPPAGQRIDFKIGAHCGAIVASRLGGASHEHITATGDTVNIASRLMEVAAAGGARLAISDELLRAAGASTLLSGAGRLDGPARTPIRGREGNLAVWLWRGR